jgi:hypothetical protein
LSRNLFYGNTLIHIVLKKKKGQRAHCLCLIVYKLFRAKNPYSNKAKLTMTPRNLKAVLENKISK